MGHASGNGRRPRKGRQQEQQRIYRRRRLAVFSLGIALVIGLYYGLGWVLTKLFRPT